MTDGALIQMLVILLLSFFHESTSYGTWYNIWKTPKVGMRLQCVTIYVMRMLKKFYKFLCWIQSKKKVWFGWNQISNFFFQIFVQTRWLKSLWSTPIYMVAHKLASVTIYTTSLHVFDLLPNCNAPD